MVMKKNLKFKKKLETDKNQIIEKQSQDIGQNLAEHKRTLRTIFQNCSDIIFRDIMIQGKVKVLLIYADGMIDTDLITSNLLKPLFYNGLPHGLGTIDSISEMLEQEHLSILQLTKLSNYDEIAEHIVKGNVAILSDEEERALLADVSSFEIRAIQEPFNEATIRGPKEGFIEALRVNTSMLRRILATPKLKFESVTLGKVTKREIVITYLEGIVSKKVLDEVRKRVNRIQLDAIIESGYIEESIEETQLSPFPQIMVTERPDVVATHLLKGKVAIIVDGDSCVLILPMTFWDGLKAPDDYYERFVFVSLIRWLRFIFGTLSVLLPSIYVALSIYHQEMVPDKLMLSIAALRENAPFPTVMEVFIMEFMFEGLREAGIRLPKLIGPLVSIVGAFVIGEQAVNAGLISAPIVIVVSASGISSFIIPRYRFDYALRILRFPLLIFSGTFGLFGLAVGLIAIIIHLIHLTSFGVPYLSPAAPLNISKLKDVLIRWPRKLVKHPNQ